MTDARADMSVYDEKKMCVSKEWAAEAISDMYEQVKETTNEILTTIFKGSRGDTDVSKDELDSAFARVTDGMVLRNLVYNNHPILHSMMDYFFSTFAPDAPATEEEYYIRKSFGGMARGPRGKRVVVNDGTYDPEVEKKKYEDRVEVVRVRNENFLRVLAHPVLSKFLFLPFYKDEYSFIPIERSQNGNTNVRKDYFLETFGITLVHNKKSIFNGEMYNLQYVQIGSEEYTQYLFDILCVPLTESDIAHLKKVEEIVSGQ